MEGTNAQAKKFRGVYTAIVTPFESEDGPVDYTAYSRLVSMQIRAGVSGIVPIGTTGESPTLSDREVKKIIKITVRKCKGRCQVIAGSGGNSTAHTIEKCRMAEFLGVDGLLVVNPYYNKPTQEGLYRHFKQVALSVKIPVIIYNIKSRTGVNVETATLMRIVSDCPNVIGVKEASGDLSQMKAVIALRPKYFSVLSGDDGLTLDLIKAGGDGVVSVVSNLVPKKLVEFVGAAIDGNMAKAEAINKELSPLFSGAFIETNPIPIKAALAMKGLIKEVYRLPMCEMRPENRQKWELILRENGGILC